MDLEDFIFDANDSYNHHYDRDLTNDQIEWLQIIWEEFADDDGYIDWSEREMHDSAWYYYMSEILGYDDDVIERYLDD